MAAHTDEQAMTTTTEPVIENDGYFFDVVYESTLIRQHVQLFMWLQGDLQDLLAHDVLMVAHGDIQGRRLRFDVISSIGGLRDGGGHHADIEDLIVGLFDRWQRHGRNGYTLSTSAGVILNGSCQCNLHRTLRSMRSVMVQGIRDQRAGIDVFYVLFRTGKHFDDESRRMFDILLPYIDSAVQRIADTTHPSVPPGAGATAAVSAMHPVLPPLSERESEIMYWVGKGKTNYDIGMILGISPFTVKNHLQRIFRKIDVSNRAQAVSRFEGMNWQQQ